MTATVVGKEGKGIQTCLESLQQTIICIYSAYWPYFLGEQNARKVLPVHPRMNFLNDIIATYMTWWQTLYRHVSVHCVPSICLSAGPPSHPLINFTLGRSWDVTEMWSQKNTSKPLPSPFCKRAALLAEGCPVQLELRKWRREMHYPDLESRGVYTTHQTRSGWLLCEYDWYTTDKWIPLRCKKHQGPNPVQSNLTNSYLV